MCSKLLAKSCGIRYGIEPVFPGYSGMVPHDAKEKLGLNVTEPELWNGYLRPAFLQPTDSRFKEIAALYYKERKLFSVKPITIQWTRSTKLKELRK